MTRLFETARQARDKASLKVGYRPDGAVLLALGGEPQEGPAQPRSIHYHPLKSNDRQTCQRQLEALRSAHPGLWVHGLSPGWLSKHGGPPQVDSLALYTGPLQGSEPASEGWEGLLELEVPKVASLTYAPSDPEEALVERLGRLARAVALASVVLLPRSQGDRVMVPGATTDGAQDMAFLSRARLVLPAQVHLRASWAALGWKLAQAALCFGADELAGWGLEEQLAYSGRGRPASVVEAAEVEAGIREARREPLEVMSCDWAS